MSWCPYDSSFLLTCSKDNRTICWDTVSGEVYCNLNISKLQRYIMFLFSETFFFLTMPFSLCYLLQIISELPASANWNFDLHWYRKIPGVIAASSFDGKIGIYNLEVMMLIFSHFGMYAGYRLLENCHLSL